MTRSTSCSSLSVATLAVLAVGCATDPLRDYFVDRTPRQRYEAALTAAGLAQTALARDWITAGETALGAPSTIQTPYRELGYLDPSRPRADAYRIELQRGQRLLATIEFDGDAGPQLFIDLFVIPSANASSPVLLATADSLSHDLDYTVGREGAYLLRVQAELLRGGRYTLTIDATASLEFPVVGRDTRAIRSGFGASRDAGRRSHHGVDIFAPRGTPVIAASAGRVTWVGTNRLGGNVVWMRERALGYSLYYAHLDSQAVQRGTLVEPGDTLGFVGNTGNARTTPPHLHFGIYRRGTGPLDPYPFLHRSNAVPATISADPTGVGGWVRVARDGVRFRAVPSTATGAVAELARHTALRVLAATGSWYRVSLPDGSGGFVAARFTEPVERPVRIALLDTGSLVREWPAPSAAAVDSVTSGDQVPVLGIFGSFAFVATPNGRTGWLAVE